MTTTTTTAHDLVNRSFGRCCNADEFFNTFYSDLMDRYAEISDMFAETDFNKQNELLRVALELMLMFDYGSDAARQAMSNIRETHSQGQRNVKPEFYDNWMDSLMRACAKHDTEFNQDIENAWREVLSGAINYIKSGYYAGRMPVDVLSYLNSVDSALATVVGEWVNLTDSAQAEILDKVKAST